MCRDRPHDLRLDVTDLVGHVGSRQELTPRPVPAETEVLVDVRDGRTLDPNGRVVPPDSSPRDMRRRVPRVAAVEGEVDAADEGDSPVDHDHLLVVAVREPGAAVRVRLDPRVPRERVEHLAHLPLGGLEHRNGSTLPGEDAYVDPLSQLGEQVAHHHRLLLSREMELGGEEPARQMDVRLRARELRGDRGERFRAVHEHVEPVPWPRGKASVRVRELGRVESVLPAVVT